MFDIALKSTEAVEKLHPDEKERIVGLVRLYKAILNRLASVGFISPEEIS